MAILVMGVPRSGTSAVAGVLHHLGVNMGRSLEANAWNERGFFQDADFEAAITRALPSWFPEWQLFPGQEIESLARSRSGLWGVKSNRMAYVLDSFMRGAGEVKIITTSRPRSESIASFAARSGKGKEHSSQEISRCESAIVAGMKACGVSPVLTVDYDSLLKSPADSVAEIASVVGVEATAEAVTWIDETLRRFKHG